MDAKQTRNFYLNSAMTGLSYSILFLLAALLVLFLIGLKFYAIKDMLYLMTHTRFNTVDWFSIMEGLALFVALPIILAIRRDLKNLGKSA